MRWNLTTFFLFLGNIFSGTIAFLIFEYEFAKLRNPQTSWAETPQGLFFVFAVILIILTLINLSIILISFIKKLDKPELIICNRKINILRFVVITSFINIFISGLIIIVLNNKITFVLFPWIDT